MLFHIHQHDEGALSVVKRPRPSPWLNQDLLQLKSSGVTDLICLLPLRDAQALGLQDEGKQATALGMTFHRLPIEDFGVPKSHLNWLDTIAPLLLNMRGGHHLAVHCRASIGRATLFATSLLLCEGKSANAALAIVQSARGLSVPDTEEQSDWIRHLEIVLKAHRAHLVFS